MFNSERKNRENFGQEIFFGNVGRKLKNALRLLFIFFVVFAISQIVFLTMSMDMQSAFEQMKNIISWISSKINFLKPSSNEFKLIIDSKIFVWSIAKSLAIATTFTICSHFLFLYIGKNSSKEQILDGASEETVKSINDRIYKWTLKWLKEEKKRIRQRYDFFMSCDLGAAGLETLRKYLYGRYLVLGDMHLIFITEEILKTHIGIEGATGTGKTVLINSFLDQIREHPNSQVCILDYNGQFYSKFGRKNDKIISINDKRSVKWHPWCENIAPEKIAHSLIENDPNDKFFGPAAKSLFANLMMLNRNIEDFWKDMNRSKDELFEKLKKYELSSAGDFEGSSGNQGAGVRRTMSLSLDALRTLNHWTKNKEEFSIIDWAKNGSKDWHFIIVREEDLEKAKPWLRLWMDLVVTGILMRNEKANNNATWLIADELPILGKIPSLQKGITNGRKYNFRTIIGYQTEGQLDEVYDKESKGIKNSVRTRIIFNPGDHESSIKCAETLGKKEIYDPLESESYGSSIKDSKSSVSSTNQIREKFVVHPSKLRQLDKMECYLKLPIFNPVFMKIPLKNYESINNAHECEDAPRLVVGE